MPFSALHKNVGGLSFCLYPVIFTHHYPPKKNKSSYLWFRRYRPLALASSACHSTPGSTLNNPIYVSIMLYFDIINNMMFVSVGKLFVSAGPVHGLRRSRGADGHHAGPQVRGWNAALPVARLRWPPAAPEQARPGHETQMRGHAGHCILEV